VKKLLGVIVGIALVLMLFSLIAGRMEKPQLKTDQISALVPLGSSRAQVSAILDSNHIEHFAYEVDPDNKRLLVAISRGSKWSLVREDHSVRFNLDMTDHLISKEVRTTLTGP
jgi:hypothetical protein